MLKRCGLRRPCVVLDPLMDLSPEVLVTEESKRVIFASAFTRGPNAEGAIWFLGERVACRRPVRPGRQHRVGRERICRNTVDVPDAGASATGYMPDLRMASSGCAAAIAPLLRGAGFKFKVPQALAYGLPVVTTRVGAEGLSTRLSSCCRQ